MDHKETTQQQQELLITLPFAEGAVDPTDRISRGIIHPEKITELAQRIKDGEFTIYGDTEAIPCICMDCRPTVDGDPTVGPKAAGGTFTAVVADALTFDSYRQPGENAAAHKARLFEQLQANSYRPGGHIPAGFPKNKEGGCGAEGKLHNKEASKPSIFRFMKKNSDNIFNTLRALDYEVDRDTEVGINDKLSTLIDEGYASSGAELAKVGVEVAPKENFELEDAPQLAVVVALMTRPGEYLDQKRIQREYGHDYQVFEIETWAVKNSAKATSLSEEEQTSREIAAMAYQLGASGVIGGPGLGIVVV